MENEDMYCRNCGELIEKIDADFSDTKAAIENNDSNEKIIEGLFKIYNYAITKPIYLDNPNTKLYIKKTIELKNEIRNNLKKINNAERFIYTNTVLQCISNYVETEMDFITPGIRGIGRVSTSPPRFGGFFSKYLRRLTQKELDTIKDIITDIVHFGYGIKLQIEILSGKLEEPKGFTFNYLHEKWIPSIYGTNMTANLPENIRGFLNDSMINSTIYFYYEMGNKTNFPKKFINTKKISKSGWLNTMIIYYVDAGFILRFVETFNLK